MPGDFSLKIEFGETCLFQSEFRKSQDSHVSNELVVELLCFFTRTTRLCLFHTCMISRKKELKWMMFASWCLSG